MSTEQRGHVKVARRFFAEDPFWMEPREFSRAEAWLDLVQRAAWRQHRQVMKGSLVELDRGEFLASLRYLTQAWGWGIKKVRIFLDQLVQMERIRAQRDTHFGTVYVVVNYARYQTSGPREEESKGTVGAQSGHSRGTLTTTHKGTGKASNHAENSTTGAHIGAHHEIENGAKQGTNRSSKAVEAVVGQSVVHPLRASSEIDTEHLITLAIRAANAGMGDNPRVDQARFRPILPQHGGSRQQARDWFEAGIPWETVLEGVYYSALEYKPSDREPQVRTLTYFNNPVRDRHELDASRAIARPERKTQPIHPEAEVNGVRSETPGRARAYLTADASKTETLVPFSLSRIMAEMKEKGFEVPRAAGGAP